MLIKRSLKQKPNSKSNFNFHSHKSQYQNKRISNHYLLNMTNYLKLPYSNTKFLFKKDFSSKIVTLTDIIKIRDTSVQNKKEPLKTIHFDHSNLQYIKNFISFSSLKKRIRDNISEIKNNINNKELTEVYRSIHSKYYPLILDSTKEETINKSKLIDEVAEINNLILDNSNIIGNNDELKQKFFILYEKFIAYCIQNHLFDHIEFKSKVTSDSEYKDFLLKIINIKILFENIDIKNFNESELEMIFPFVIFINSIYNLSTPIMYEYFNIYLQIALETIELSNPFIDKFGMILKNFDKLINESVIESYINFKDLFINSSSTIKDVLIVVIPIMLRALEELKELEKKGEMIEYEKLYLSFQELLSFYFNINLENGEMDNNLIESFFLLLIEMNSTLLKGKSIIHRLSKKVIDHLSEYIFKILYSNKEGFFNLETPFEILLELQKIIPNKNEQISKFFIENITHKINLTFEKIKFLLIFYGKEYVKERENLICILTSMFINEYQVLYKNDKLKIVEIEKLKYTNDPKNDSESIIFIEELTDLFETFYKYNPKEIFQFINILSVNKELINADLNNIKVLEAYSTMIAYAIDGGNIKNYFSNPLFIRFIYYFKGKDLKQSPHNSSFFISPYRIISIIDLNIFPRLTFSLINIANEYNIKNNQLINETLSLLYNYVNNFGLRISTYDKKFLISSIQMIEIINPTIINYNSNELNKRIFKFIWDEVYLRKEDDEYVDSFFEKNKYKFEKNIQIKFGYSSIVMNVNSNKIYIIILDKSDSQNISLTRIEEINYLYLKHIVQKGDSIVLLNKKDLFDKNFKTEELNDKIFNNFLLCQNEIANEINH